MADGRCRGNKKCRGPGLKLSWPRPENRRRAVVSESTRPSSSVAVPVSHARFIHTSHWDMELHNSLTSGAAVQNLSMLQSPSLPKLSALGSHDRDLLEYFYYVASAALPAFCRDVAALRDTLVHIATQGEMDSAAAVVQGLLAFASLHRHGLQSQTVELKTAAVGYHSKALGTASSDAEAIAQHIATGMLLCSCEVLQPSSTLGQWTFYLSGVKKVLDVASPETLSYLSYARASLLDWVHYYTALARFSLLHWDIDKGPQVRWNSPAYSSLDMTHLPPPVCSILSLLSQICDIVDRVPEELEAEDGLENLKKYIQILDWRIRTLAVPKVKDENSDAANRLALLLQLFQLAMLLFLTRSFESLTGQSLRMQQYVSRAFSIIPDLKYCRQHFPIYVTGCEARTDEQRIAVLDLISRTEKVDLSRSYDALKKILVAVWVQDDLAGESNTSYREKLSTVMSHCEFVLSLV
ncbi:fungal-specific transcription factor domain-containing protein [Hypoxylon argillaceum]|nr:fungal-specific transcription factor domain-containing protein [Hypoxylon argillaceum]